MSSPKKLKSSFGGFSTGNEFMTANNMVGGTTVDERRDDSVGAGNSFITASNMMMTAGERQIPGRDDSVGDNDMTKGDEDSMQQSCYFGGGFSTAKEFMEMKATDQFAEEYSSNNKSTRRGKHHGAANVPTTKSEELDDASALLRSDQTSMTVHLTVRGLKYYKENQEAFENITLRRQTDNIHDDNAIEVLNGQGNKLGMIAWEQAATLAEHLDSNTISLDDVTLVEQKDTILVISTTVSLLDKEKKMDFGSTILPRILSQQTKTKSKNYRKEDIITQEAITQLAQGITAQDSETASTCPFDILQCTSMPWKKNADGTVAVWPPTQDFLNELGYGRVDDEQWWQENTGLKPPSSWNVTGAIDLLPNIPGIASHQKTKAADALDDAIHGVTNVWSDETLNEVRDLMHSDNFWCFRGADAFIVSYGGPYVLGQQEGKLTLIKGTPHTPLTDRMCRGHNVVYELVHMAKPPAPGFNTLIFGLNLRRSGFHYHQDTIASLKPKNAPLVGKQPVVTTVYYEKPEVDNGKELVLWKPLFNFRPRDDSLYMAARGVQTTHGMVHVQRSGLQSHAHHGIFHTPIFEDGNSKPTCNERKGFRVAITARITYPNSNELLQPYIDGRHYKRVLGPDGNKTLRL